MQDFPQTWLPVSFGDVVINMSNGIGGKQNKEGLGIPVSRIETIADQSINYNRVGFISDYDETKLDRYRLNSGDILFSHINSPAHLGKTALVGSSDKLYHGINLLRIVVNSNVFSSKLFNYYCKYTRLQGEFSLRAQHAVNQSSINQKKLSEFEIPILPLAEQKQIAAKLDELLAQVDTLKIRLDTIPTILKRFRQSVLAAAVSGKLTEEWRECSKLSNWEYMPLNDLNVKIQIGPFGSLLHKSDYVVGGVSLVNPMHIKNGRIFPSDAMTITIDKASELERYMLKRGDVVLGRRGEMGRAAVVECNGLICGTGSLFLRPDQVKHESKFLQIFLSSVEVIKYLGSGSVGSTMANLNQKILKNMPLPNVSKKEQTEIVRKVEQYFTFADQIEQRVKDAQKQVNNLTQSILAKAFRGELTAEWREQNPELISGENSAEALLTRIKAEREKLQPVRNKRATNK